MNKQSIQIAARGRASKPRAKKAASKPSLDRDDPSQAEALAYRTPISAAVHEGMEDLYELGFVPTREMRKMDASCLVPVETMSAPDIAALRKREQVSQSVLARYLGVATATVGQWERGLRKPDGPVLKLLSLIERNGLDYIR